MSKKRLGGIDGQGYRKLDGKSQLIGFLGFLMLFVFYNVGIAEDWATYLSEITRSSITSETIGPRLFLQWKYIPTHRHKPAGPMPSQELPRMHPLHDDNIN